MAACKDEAPEVFEDDAPSGASGRAEYTPAVRKMQVRHALWFCQRCPVREACLADAFETRDNATIRGGLTVAARRAMVGESAGAA